MPDYVVDVPFVRQFCRELSPTLLRAAASLGGFPAPDVERPFAYCEVGSGTGDTLCTLAAAYPESRFIGVDLNREHVALSRLMAERGGLGNVTVFEGDFEDHAPELPSLDFICAHGLLSWVAPAKRHALARLAASRLTPAGVLYVSYNALPGWASLQPLRRILREAGGTAGSSLDRARRALVAAKAMRAGGARYFTDNPAAGEMLDTMERAGLAYVVHEYFHDHWAPMHFADVAGEMASAGLRFAGELPLYRSVARLTLPGATSDIVAAAKDRLEAETLKDIATNAFFRGDLYVRGDHEPDASLASAYLDATPFGTLVTADRVRREVKLPNAELHLLGEPFDTIVARAAAGPTALADLRDALRAFDVARLREAFVDLLVTEQFAPMRKCAASTDAHAYNLSVLAQPLSESRPVVLASPIAGTGVALPALQAVCLRMLLLVDAAGRDAAIRAFVERQPVRLHVADRPVSDASEQANVIASEIEKFRASRLPKLAELGVVRASMTL